MRLNNNSILFFIFGILLSCSPNEKQKKDRINNYQSIVDEHRFDLPLTYDLVSPTREFEKLQSLERLPEDFLFEDIVGYLGSVGKNENLIFLSKITGSDYGMPGVVVTNNEGIILYREIIPGGGCGSGGCYNCEDSLLIFADLTIKSFSISEGGECPQEGDKIVPGTYFHVKTITTGYFDPKTGKPLFTEERIDLAEGIENPGQGFDWRK